MTETLDNLIGKSYTVEETAGILGVSIFTVRNYIKSGKLKAVKMGRYYRIKEADLQDFLNSAPNALPDLVQTLQLHFTDNEHKQKFLTWLQLNGSDDKERTSLVYLLFSNPLTRENLTEIYHDEMMEPESLTATWQTSETRNLCRLAFNLFNGWMDRENPRNCSLPALMDYDSDHVKMDALKIRFS